MRKTDVRKEIIKYAGPGILGLVANSLYIVVDGIFVAKMLGANSLAAVTTVVPIVEILIALSLMISIGGGIYISICQGKGQLEESRVYFNHGLVFTIGISIGILILGILLRSQIVGALGATPDIMDEAINYFTWFIAFVPFFTLNYALGTWIRNDGKPNLAMAGQVIGAIANIVLDYIFMGPLNMGIAGAAIATGLGPVIGIAIVMPHFLGKKGTLYIEKFKWSWKYIKDILIGGLPSFSIEFALGAMSFLCNLFISAKLGAQGLAAFGVIGYINLILLSVFLGIGQGTQPLVSRFYGQSDLESIQYIYKFSASFSFLLGVIGYGLLLFVKAPITAIFIDSSDIELTNLTMNAINLFFITFAITGVNVATASIFEAKHSVAYSIMISFLRAFGLLLPTLFVMNTLGNSMALWLAVPIAEVLTLPVSLLLWKRDSRETKEQFEKSRASKTLGEKVQEY
ncbi:MAG: MATE family efflux transporter [Tissierellia bacterium]|nr:MATE family efflux transporter [Tissierellia bacterium]